MARVHSEFYKRPQKYERPLLKNINLPLEIVDHVIVGAKPLLVVHVHQIRNL